MSCLAARASHACDGPPVCADHFAPRRTVKLQLPPVVRYTHRNAAEQFLAVRAPGCFFGNSFSTFSKGVALLRSAAARNASFAYDCALPATRTWRQPGARVTLAHPGFELLRTIPGACHPR